MTNKAISTLSAATALTGAELVPVVQGGITKRATAQEIAGRAVQCISVACSDQVTPLTTGVKATFRMPFAMTLTEVKASLKIAQAGGNIITVDVHESSTTVLSTKLTIDNTEKTSATASASAVISDSSLALDAEIEIEIDQIGDGTAVGLVVHLLGYLA